MLNRKFKNVNVDGKLKMGKGSSFVATSSAGVETTVDMTDLAVVGGLTASAAELNTMTGILATTAELNRVCDSSTRVVSSTATVVAVSATVHGSKVFLQKAAAASAATLPAASGTGEIYTYVLGVAATATAHTVLAAGTDVIHGATVFSSSATAERSGFASTAGGATTITINGTTQGGAIGDKIVLIDIAANKWSVAMHMTCSGTVVTPFS